MSGIEDIPRQKDVASSAAIPILLKYECHIDFFLSLMLRAVTVALPTMQEPS
jgi:hypothetical protein